MIWSRSIIALVGACAMLTFPSLLRADKRCAYLADDGTVGQVDSPNEAPRQYRSRVICADESAQGIPESSEVDLGNIARTANFVSDIGPISARWPRSVERCFGRAPNRALADAAQTVDRALASGPFLPELKNRSTKWDVLFIDKETALREFPAAVTIGGHPGFMIPPNRIYFISDFISPQCDPSQVADTFLAQVILHEMGHVIEFLMLGADFGMDRARAEGFASWFEQYSANFSRIIPRGSVQGHYRKLAAEAMKTFPTEFEGTPYDYARAALQFDAIVGRRGVAGLMSLYNVIRTEHIPFHAAVEKSLRWSRKNLEQEMMNLLKEK